MAQRRDLLAPQSTSPPALSTWKPDIVRLHCLAAATEKAG
ncbi:hypothetical protein MA6G0728R_3167 [Mycobacteroides abscessus 6G-0728-R]|uniref:Uncharacterized protein n=1 Tax=Mycobacteroides abscessus 1948 TaxID=1299323 RepID=A0A829QFU4_9MYCO|nr:hypothetical protein MA4S0726RA_2764 [Mycobacteroides abscessus 4S-0726-RA]EIT97289.1 hypothetical protein MA4S0303_2830 [Mycobacteroides abscessus 4S-0303]EIT98572.1 hypothetical protein MA4S0726RB_2354 [Mycobacteroides abscessus 4S-0726-RB]EIU38445.1 hypothetical protein MA6G0125R_2198 [Mycobacteroides abscessus 6G-0125-R]EIU47039.1 hypothetical protein MA6G0125S_3236 [Mycobacteroides abscessus 6G-0125-S]EIU57880.1 hypothetical protein MA6G0728S_2921 [Mycobacteroides abscessus 6G-0728-S]